MKNNIKEEQERLIIKEELLNENTLIQHEYDRENDKVRIVIRYIEYASIKEHTLNVMSVHEYASEFDKRVRINEDNSSIAIFDKNEDGYALRNCYDLNEHEFTPSDFVDLEFNKKFPNVILNKFLVLAKKK